MIRAIDANALVPVIAAEYYAAYVPTAFEQLARGPFGNVMVKF